MGWHASRARFARPPAAPEPRCRVRGMNLRRRLPILAAALMLVLLSSCTTPPAPEVMQPAKPTAIPTSSEIAAQCRETASAAADAVQLKGNAHSETYTQLAQSTETLGEPYGVPSAWGTGVISDPYERSDWSLAIFSERFDFEDIYARVTTVSPWKSPPAHAAYIAAHERCSSPPKSAERTSTASSNSTSKLIECIATTIVDVEAKTGHGQVSYTPTYLKYVRNRMITGDKVESKADYGLHELTFARVTGLSPFVNADAVVQFRQRAQACVS